MKLGLSNLSYAGDLSDSDLKLMAELGFSGIEVAPTRIAPWSDLGTEKIRAFKTSLASAGFTVPSLQAIFLGVDGLQLLGDHSSFERMIAHMHVVGRIAEEFGARIAVFGAPRQRTRGTLTEEAAFQLGIDRLSKLADTSSKFGLTIALEPVPSAYGCDFLNTWQLVKSMVDAVALPGLAVHLDTGCVTLGDGDIGEAVEQCAERLAHFHAAEPHLRDFEYPEAFHQSASYSLHATGYDKWVVIEMLEGNTRTKNAHLVAAQFVADTYGIRSCP